MLTIKFNDVDGKITATDTLTSGMVGRKIKLEFSPDWDNLRKTIVFQAGTVTRDVLDPGEVVEIPAKVLERPGHRLFIGAYGVAEDETVTPTIYVAGPYIMPGANPSGDESTAPDLAVWAQLQKQIGSAVKAVNGITPDENGNVAVQTAGGGVQSVNGLAPDKSGNVEVPIPNEENILSKAKEYTDSQRLGYAKPATLTFDGHPEGKVTIRMMGESMAFPGAFVKVSDIPIDLRTITEVGFAGIHYKEDDAITEFFGAVVKNADIIREDPLSALGNIPGYGNTPESNSDEQFWIISVERDTDHEHDEGVEVVQAGTYVWYSTDIDTTLYICRVEYQEPVKTIDPWLIPTQDFLPIRGLDGVLYHLYLYDGEIEIIPVSGDGAMTAATTMRMRRAKPNEQAEEATPQEATAYG